MKRAMFLLVGLAAGAACAADAGVTIKTVDEQLCATLRFQGQFTDVGQYLGELYAVVGAAAAGPAIALYYDGPEVPVHDIEVCAPVSAAVDTDKVKTRKLEGGKFAVLIHKGAYTTIGETWSKLTDYCVARGLKIAGPGREVYVAFDPDDPSQNVTEVMVPVGE